MLQDLLEVVKATRPWSFTAAIIPVLVTAAFSGSSFVSQAFVVTMVMGLFIQAGANLTNTYYDYMNNIDTVGHGELTLVEGKLTPFFLFELSFLFYAIATFAVWTVVQFSMDWQLIAVFMVGILLAFFYTADPIGLKYHALGDVVVFLCFGPLLMQCSSLMLTGKQSWELNLYAVPIGCITEAMLHANNSRDIETDGRAGAVTLAGLLGIHRSRQLYEALLVGSYLSVLYIALFQRIGCALCFLTIPMALDLAAAFRRGDLYNLEQRTAQLHLPFGLLMFVGILVTTRGLL